jgi:hypothetical protein
MENSTFDIKKEVLDDAIDIINPSKILGKEMSQFNFDIPTQGKIVDIVNKFINQQISTEDFISNIQNIVTNEEDFDKLMNIITEKITNPLWDIIETHSMLGDELIPKIEDTENENMDESEHQALYDAGIEIEGFVPKAPEKKYGEEIFPNEDLSVHEKMLSEELAKTESKEIVEVPKKLEEIPQNFMEQKLGEVVRNTSSDSDQSIPAITKKEVEKFDPYREKI